MNISWHLSEDEHMTSSDKLSGNKAVNVEAASHKIESVALVHTTNGNSKS